MNDCHSAWKSAFACSTFAKKKGSHGEKENVGGYYKSEHVEKNSPFCILEQWKVFLVRNQYLNSNSGSSKASACLCCWTSLSTLASLDFSFCFIGFLGFL